VLTVEDWAEAADRDATKNAKDKMERIACFTDTTSFIDAR
jgi:hypothetical protein